MRVRFALLSEGTSEHGLIPHLEELCVRFGAAEAEGRAPDLSRLRRPPGKALEPRLRALRGFEPDVDFICVHRDADRAGVEARRQEIADAVAAVGWGVPVVPLIPLTMLEAWLLLDADAIRAAVGCPRGRGRLELPKVRQIETIAQPKTRLKELLAEASEASGARLRSVRDDFPGNRRFLLDRLDLDGPINQLGAWQAMLSDLQDVLSRLGR